MDRFVDAQLVTEPTSRFGWPDYDPAWVAISAHLEVEEAGRLITESGLDATELRLSRMLSGVAISDETVFFVRTAGLESEGEGMTRFGWGEIDPMANVPEGVRYRIKANTATSTSISLIRRLLQAHRREDRLRRLPADRRAVYERIVCLREQSGPIEFDVVEAVRELREDA